MIYEVSGLHEKARLWQKDGDLTIALDVYI
jgi:hypothetical protein